MRWLPYDAYQAYLSSENNPGASARALVDLLSAGLGDFKPQLIAEARNAPEKIADAKSRAEAFQALVPLARLIRSERLHAFERMLECARGLTAAAIYGESVQEETPGRGFPFAVYR